MRRFALILIALLLALPLAASAREEQEEHYKEPTQQEQEAATAFGVPSGAAVELQILAPAEGQTYEKGGTLTVKASGTQLTRMTATLVSGDKEQTFSVDGAALEHVFDTAMYTDAATLTVTGYFLDTLGGEQSSSASVAILAPREKLFDDMFALAYKNSKDSYYRHAPAQNDGDRGVCKNFVMRLFDTFKADYRMAQYPDLELHMPKNKSKKDSAPYQYGIEWRDESAEDGSPFYIAAQYKYDDSLTKAENTEKCRQVLRSVQRGDFFQMCGDYYHGNGPHSLLQRQDSL